MTEPEKTVWILGAGFSRSLGAPMLADLLTMRSVVTSTFNEFFEHDLQYAVALLYESGAWGVKHVRMIEPQWEHAEEFLERLDQARMPENFSDMSAGSASQDGLNMMRFATRVLGELDKTRQMHPLSEGHEKGCDALAAHFAPPKKLEIALEELHLCALKMVAAECAEFVHRVVPSTRERWAPYIRWAQLVKPTDAVVTFNYDRVPEVLAAEEGAMLRTFVPKHQSTDGKCPVYKMHGSIDWHLNLFGVQYDPKHWQSAFRALLCMNSSEVAMATPGRRKREMVAKGGEFEAIWEHALDAIHHADRIIFVGYRMPPSDAYTREWLINAVLKNRAILRAEQVERRGGGGLRPLRLVTVLGDNVMEPHSRRLQGLFESLMLVDVATVDLNVKVRPVPLWAEDFLATFYGGP